MYINERMVELLKVDKADRIQVFSRTIYNYMETMFPERHDYIDDDGMNIHAYKASDKLPDGLRIRSVGLYSSGNEPKIYGHVEGTVPKNGKDEYISIWSCRHLSNDEETFGNVAKYTGAAYNAICAYFDLNNL